jgi:phosphate starvation-inducible membrane PsiE
MYRLFSVLASFFVISIGFFSFFYHNSDFGWDIFYYDELLLYINTALIFLLVIKSQIRWQKLFMTSSLKGFLLTKVGWNKSLINECLPFFIYIPIGILLFIYIPEQKWFCLILLIYILEGITHLILGLKKYKLIIIESSILILRNKQSFIFWKNIKTIVFKHQGIIIVEKTGRDNFVSEVDFENFKELKIKLNELAISKNIYIEF